MTHTYVPIEIEGRTVTVEVQSLHPLTRMQLAMELSDILAIEQDEQLTLEEMQEVGVTLLTHQTDLPRDLIEQLPFSAHARLVKAADQVEQEAMREARQRVEEFKRRAKNDEETANMRLAREAVEQATDEE